ncbi:MAG: hypothetical protein A2W25_14200 [candidate division Zixibacteria bacterium RBG_16_53_22]|nr:MAG: hypothetical protein A2W25_14200 [candidate division Zixibacteria bacterium RBG_16_53_22]
MAVRPFKTFLIILILIVAGVGAIYIVQSRRHYTRRMQYERFVSAYVALSIAREKYPSSPDSLSMAYDSILAAHGVDSAWLSSFAASLSADIHQSSRIWDKIVARLDSLRTASQPDSTNTN